MGRGYISQRSGLLGRSAFLAALLTSTSIGLGLFFLDRPALAQAQQTTFSIPAGPLSLALAAFGRQAGLQVTYLPSLASGKTSPGVSGDLSAEAALSHLLQGTGLSYSYAGIDTVTITEPKASAPVTADGSIILDQIDVTAWVENAAGGSGFQGTPDWVYETPESVSVVSREAVRNSGVRDTRDLMATVSGVYSGEGMGSFPTVSPNIRGMQDSGRVVVSIDGARQNAQRGYGYGSGGYQSNSGQAYVDSAFIRSVEIDKNPDASAGNAGALAGSANFRTVGADDLIEAGRAWGVEVDGVRGNNEYNFQGSILGAARLGDSPLSVTAGISRLNMGAYAVGKNGEDVTGTMHFRGRDAFSSLFKLEGDFGDVRTSLSWMHQVNEFSYGFEGGFENDETVHVDSVTGQLTWDPDNDLIDLDARLWLNNALTNELREARLGGTPPDTYIDMNTLSFGGDVQNTSTFDTPVGVIDLHYGAEAFHDGATASASSATIDLDSILAANYTAFSPPGNRDVASAFVSADWEAQDWLTLSGGLRYDWYHLHGTATYYNEYDVNNTTAYTVQCVVPLAPFPGAPCGEVIDGSFVPEGVVLMLGSIEHHKDAHDLNLDRSGGEFLPTLKAEFKPVEWFKPYISYSQSFRPPTVLEAFFAGGLPGDGSPTNFAPNTSLRPERARTIEIGANISRDDVFTDNDRLRVKVAAFQRDIDDFIVLGRVLAPDVADRTYLGFVNLDGTMTLRGLEVEGNYDAGQFWIGGSATWLEASWPQSTETFSNGTLTTDGTIFATAGNIPPRFKLTIDGGVHLLDQKLQLGARINHVTPTQSRLLDKEGNFTETTDPYTTVDVYGSYRFNDNATLRMAINNVTDLNYIPAAGSYNAPGRTFTAALNVKF